MLELIKVKYDQDIKKQLEKRFIAFDVETTGLNPKEERIIELGAVLFENASYCIFPPVPDMMQLKEFGA